jgi:hypothetical protein
MVIGEMELMKEPDLAQRRAWDNRLRAVGLGVGLALTLLTVRHWYETFLFGHPLCEDCRPDFPQFYAGARLVWQSPAVLYDPTKQLEIQKIIDPRITEILPYTYPPVTALLLVPLGWLPFPSAYAAMTALNILLLMLSIRLLIGKLHLTKDQSTWLILSALCNFGVHSVVLQGQISLVVLLLLAIFAIMQQDRSGIGAGISAGLVFIKPQLLVAPFLVLLGRRMWPALAIASTVVVALIIGSITIVGWVGIEQYLSLIGTYLTIERGYGSYPEAMHNLRALAQYIVPFPWSRYLGLTLTGCVIAAAFLLNRRRHGDPRIVAVQWIGNFVAGILITPHLYPHDLAILIVPTTFAVKLYGSPMPTRVILSLIVMGIYPLLALMSGHRLPPLLPVGFLVILGLCVRLVRQSAVDCSQMPNT